MQKRYFLILPAACLLLVGIGFYIQRDQFAYLAQPEFLKPITHGEDHAPPAPSKTTSSAPATSTTASECSRVFFFFLFFSLVSPAAANPDKQRF